MSIPDTSADAPPESVRFEELWPLPAPAEQARRRSLADDPEPWVQVFRAGDYGEKGRYSPEDVAAIAARYSLGVHEAPVTTDHIERGPACGWVAAARARGDVLEVRLRDLTPEFREALRRREYCKPSVELFLDRLRGAPAGHEGDVPYLRAVTFLGAAAPHVKGLQGFSEGGAAATPTVSIPPSTDEVPSPMTTPQTDPKTAAPATAPAVPPTAASPQFAELQQTLAAERAAREQAEARFRELEAARAADRARIAELERASDRNRFERQFNDHLTAGRVTPGERALLEAQFHAAVAIDRAPNAARVAFREKPEAAPREVSHEELFWNGLSARSPVIEFRELASATGPERGAPASSDPDEVILREIAAFQDAAAKAGQPRPSYGEAWAEVRRSKPALFVQHG